MNAMDSIFLHVLPLARMHLTLSMMKWEDMEKK